MSVDLSKDLSLYTTPPPTSGAVLAAIVATMDRFNLSQQSSTDVITQQRYRQKDKKKTLLVYLEKHEKKIE